MNPRIYIGIDVSKESLDIAVKAAETGDGVSPAKRAAESWSTTNTEAGCEETVRRLQALSPHRIALEATGGYEQAIFRALRGAGLPAVIVQPLSVREFARAMGKRAKTDPIDALMIAYFAEVRQPAVVPLRTANQDRIAGLRALRTDLLATRVQYTNRLENCRSEVPLLGPAYAKVCGLARPARGRGRDEPGGLVPRARRDVGHTPPVPRL